MQKVDQTFKKTRMRLKSFFTTFQNKAKNDSKEIQKNSPKEQILKENGNTPKTFKTCKPTRSEIDKKKVRSGNYYYPATPSSTIIVNYHHVRQSINNDYSFLEGATTLRKFNSCPFPKSDSLRMALAKQRFNVPHVTQPLDNFYTHYNLKERSKEVDLEDEGQVLQGSKETRAPHRNNSFPFMSPKFSPSLNSIQEIEA